MEVEELLRSHEAGGFMKGVAQRQDIEEELRDGGARDKGWSVTGELARLKPLAERRAVGQKEADDAASNLDLARAAEKSAQARLGSFSGGSRVSMKMLPPRRPTLLVSVSRTRMR